MSKSPVSEKIRAILAERDNQIAFLASLEKERDEAALLAQQLEEQIASAGEPDYRNRAALDSMDSLRRHRDACLAAIKRHEEKLANRGSINNAFCNEGFQTVVILLREARDGLIEAATKAFEPFYATQKRALYFATYSDAAIAASRYIDSMVSMTQMARTAQGDGSEALAGEIEDLLKEGLKKEPDFARYFRPYRDTQTSIH